MDSIISLEEDLNRIRQRFFEASTDPTRPDRSQHDERIFETGFSLLNIIEQHLGEYLYYEAASWILKGIRGYLRNKDCLDLSRGILAKVPVTYPSKVTEAEKASLKKIADIVVHQYNIALIEGLDERYLCMPEKFLHCFEDGDIDEHRFTYFIKNLGNNNKSLAKNNLLYDNSDLSQIVNVISERWG